MERINIGFKCGCRVDGYELIHCPLHKTAPEMYEALKATLSTAIRNGDNTTNYAIDGKVCKQIYDAIAKADGNTAKESRAFGILGNNTPQGMR